MNEPGRWSLLKARWVTSAACLLLVVSQPVVAADIVLERTAVQKLLKQALFNGPQERMYLAADPCYAYLEYPAVRLQGGRLLISGHLSARVGVAAGGSCIGPGLASDFTVSGKPAFEGGVLILEDLRIDKVNDGLTDLVRQALLPRLPRAMQFDLRAAVQGLLRTPQGQVQAMVDTFSILEVTAENDQLVTRLDFKLRGR
jgi:hypothetical protein